MRCPGQDRRYWTGEVAIDAPCPKCGAEVEFFKDEGSARCSKCGHKFKNPRVSFDCAKWCAYAEECLGFVPEREQPANPAEGTLVSRLIQTVKEEYALDQSRVARALLTFQFARELLSAEGGDPRIVLAAALLLETAGDGFAEEECAARAKRILEGIGLEADTVVCVCRVLRCCWSAENLDTVESQVVADSHTLAMRVEAIRGADGGQRELAAKRELKTQAGQRRAQGLNRR